MTLGSPARGPRQASRRPRAPEVSTRTPPPSDSCCSHPLDHLLFWARPPRRDPTRPTSRAALTRPRSPRLHADRHIVTSVPYIRRSRVASGFGLRASGFGLRHGSAKAAHSAAQPCTAWLAASGVGHAGVPTERPRGARGRSPRPKTKPKPEARRLKPTDEDSV